MKALKILVLSMGVVLVIGFGFLIWGLTGGRSASTTHTMPKLAEISGIGQVAVPLPPGGKVTQVMFSEGRIAVHVTAPGPDRIIILDPVAGRMMGEFVLEPAHP